MSVQFFDSLEKSKQPYLQVHFPLIKALGHSDALFLSALMSRLKYHVLNGDNLIDSEWFYLTIERAHDLTGQGETAQNTRIKHLKSLQLIECKKMGTPCKRYFKLNTDKILKIFTDHSEVEKYEVGRKEEGKNKVVHLKPGRKIRQNGETEVHQNGETTVSTLKKQDSPSPSNIYKNPSKSFEEISFQEHNIQPSKEDESKFDYLIPVHELNGHLPEGIVGKIESVISNYTFQNNKERYEEFCQWKWALVKIYKKYQHDMSDYGFQNLFAKYLNTKETIFNVTSWLDSEALLMLGKKESKFEAPMDKQIYKKTRLSDSQKEEYRRCLNSFNLANFPWNLYNEIMDTNFTDDQINEKKNQWVGLANGIARSRVS